MPAVLIFARLAISNIGYPLLLAVQPFGLHAVHKEKASLANRLLLFPKKVG
jgi:hypothetical protein